MAVITKGADSVAQLAGFWLFADLTDDERKALQEVAVRQTVADGHVLFRTGDPTPGLHLVVEGAVRIFTSPRKGRSGSSILLARASSAGRWGWWTPPPPAPGGQAVGETQLQIIPAPAFERLLLTHPGISLKVCRVLVGKLRDARSQLDEAIFLRSRDRVPRHLVRLVERHGRTAVDGLQVGLRLTHQEISHLSGTDRETVSRVLAELSATGVVHFRKSRCRGTLGGTSQGEARGPMDVYPRLDGLPADSCG